MVFLLVLPISMKWERSTEVISTSPLGFSFMFDVGTAKFSAICLAIIFVGKSVKFLCIGCQRILNIPKLMAQQMMDSLFWAQLIAKTSDLGLWMESVRWNYSHLAAVRWPLLHSKTKPQTSFAESVATFVWIPLANPRPLQRDASWASLGEAPGESGVCCEEKCTGSTKGRLVPCFSGCSDFLALGGMFMLILAVSYTVVFVCWRGSGMGTAAGFICIGDGWAGWEPI